MNRESVSWAGPMPAITTPFRSDLSIDEEGFVANIDRLFTAGATGMVAAGCTGEFWALSPSERQHLARLTVQACRGRGPAIAAIDRPPAGEEVDLGDDELLEPPTQPAVIGVEEPELLAVRDDLGEQHLMELDAHR